MKRADMLSFVTGLSTTDLVDMIFIDPVSGIQNRKAFDLRTFKCVAIIDMDSLKWINDNMGHETGDEELNKLGTILNRAFGDDAYHLSGDEFAVVSERCNELWDRLEGLQHNFNSFSYGTGASLKLADKAMQHNKASRETDGSRAARGEAPNDLEKKLLAK